MRTDLLWAGTGAVAAVFVTPDTVALFLASCAGTYASFVMGDKVEPRSRATQIAVACVIMGCTFSSLAYGVVDYFTDFTLTSGLRCGIGAALSFLMRWWLPWLIELVKSGRWVRWIPFINKQENSP